MMTDNNEKNRLEKAVIKANEANNAKSVFLSRISHDMRTPLNAIISLSDRTLVDGTTNEDKLDYLDKINMSGRYLLGIINDVLDITKIENKKMELNPEPYYIKEFIDNVGTVIGEQCKDKKIVFTITNNDSNVFANPFLVDKVRFNQIFINLLSNAVKFTPDGWP